MQPQVSEQLLPDWVKNRKLREEREKQEIELDAARSLAASLILKNVSPVFWQQFLRELKFQSSSVSAIGIRCSVSLSGNPESEQICRIEVGLADSLWPISTFVNLFYRTGRTAIRIDTENGSSSRLSFRIIGEDLRVAHDDSEECMEAAKAAEYVIRHLVDKIKPE